MYCNVAMFCMSLSLPWSFLCVLGDIQPHSLFLFTLSQPPVASKSFGAGHAGVAHDIELMQQGWLEVRGADSIIYEQVCSRNLCGTYDEADLRALSFGARIHSECVSLSCYTVDMHASMINCFWLFGIKRCDCHEYSTLGRFLPI